MNTLSRGAIHYYFDKDQEPAITIDSGDELIVETEDAVGGQLTPETAATMTHAEMRSCIPCPNPVTGPIFVRGAEPGDVIEAAILAITVCPEERYAWTIFDGGEGLLTNRLTLNEPLPESMRVLPVEGDQLLFRFRRGTVRVPVAPAVGTIGVAPAGERRYSFLNGDDFLGNIDIPGLGVGRRVLLPVRVPGGLLSLGDVHAVSGDGEISGGAADCRAVVRIGVRLHKSPRFWFSLSQINGGGLLGSVATGGSIDTAVRSAYRDLVMRLVQDHGLEKVEAYQLLSSAGRVQIGQAIPPLFHTAVAAVPEAILS